MKASSINVTARMLLVTLLLGLPDRARAYNYGTHAKIVRRAVDAMEGLTLPLPVTIPLPPGVSAADFNQYLLAVQAAPALLELLRTGLPNKLPGSNSNPLVPFLEPGDNGYPFDITFSQEPDPNHPGQMITVEHAPPCSYNGHDDLSDLSQFRIVDFHYFTEHIASPCALGDVVPSSLGPVLGWHAGTIDDHVKDSVLWFKPTNAGGLSAAKQIAITATNIAIGALIAPIVCIVKLFSDGELCDPGDIEALAEKYNPVIQIDGLLPGFGDVRSSDYTGLWHMINVDPGAGSGRYNQVRGLYYPDGGPGGLIGAADLAIIVMADLTGLTLNAYSSEGDDFYGDNDEVNRIGPAPWMIYSIGHTEFSPLHNLAKYGWDKFLQSNGTNAAGLGWPLHAIGDASEPHHVVATTAWGHRPLENAVEARREELLPDTPAEREAQIKRALTEGYQWWALLQSNNSVRDFIESLAVETRSRVAFALDWPYVDALSTAAALDGDFAADQIISGHFVDARNLLELGIGATIGFLTFAATHVHDPGSGNIACGPQDEFKIGQGCVPTVSGCSFEEIPSCIADSDCTPSGAPAVCVNSCCLLQVD